MGGLAVAYLLANVYAIVKMRVFDLARSHTHLLLHGAPSYCGALSSCWDVGSWRSCADSMNGPPNGPLRWLICGQSSERDRGASSTLDTSSVAKCSRIDDLRPMRSLSPVRARFSRLLLKNAHLVINAPNCRQLRS